MSKVQVKQVDIKKTKNIYISMIIIQLVFDSISILILFKKAEVY